MGTSIRKMKTGGLGLAVIYAFICLTSAKLTNANTDFSGQWVLNTGKSDLGQYGGRTASAKMKVTTDISGITLEKTVNGPNGEITATDKLTFDGKESSSTFAGNSTKQSTAKWADDGKTFTVSWKASVEFNGQKNDLTGSDIWSLSADGATLTIGSTTNFAGNVNATKLVYDKAK